MLISTTVVLKNAYGVNEINTVGQTTPALVMQHLANTSVPVNVKLPLTRGFVKGHKVFYITIEASEKSVAEKLMNLTGSRVAYSPALKYASKDSLANIYEFNNGIKGTGPKDFNQILRIRSL